MYYTQCLIYHYNTKYNNESKSVVYKTNYLVCNWALAWKYGVEYTLCSR